MFFEGIRSERQLLQVAADRLSLCWYLGYDFSQPLPDHSGLTRLRNRYGLAVFQHFFERVVDLCHDAGLITGKELFFDGTQVQANAAMNSLRSRWSIAARAHLDALFAGEATGRPPWDPSDVFEQPEEPVTLPAAQPGEPEPGAPARLPFRGTTEEEQQLAAANGAVWKLLEQRRRDPEAPNSRGYRRLSDDQASTTDPDATPLHLKGGGGSRLGYHDHYVVDGGKARIILAAIVTPADVMDNTPMLDLFHRVCFRWKLRPKRAVGDAKYGTFANIHHLEAAGVAAFLPMPDLTHRTNFYGLDRFRYDLERDEYICPQGKPLTFDRVKPTEEVLVYRANASACAACPVRQECTDSGTGRIIHRSVYAEEVERVKGYYATAAYQKAIRKRQVWVEPLFGEAKEWHGLRQFRLRGLTKVNIQGLLVAAGQNLKRWLAKVGWGRRHGPQGSLALAVQPLFSSGLVCGS
jgi:hypothetical protein